jgi:hypothetical protein
MTMSINSRKAGDLFNHSLAADERVLLLDVDSDRLVSKNNFFEISPAGSDR